MLIICVVSGNCLNLNDLAENTYEVYSHFSNSNIVKRVYTPGCDI